MLSKKPIYLFSISTHPDAISINSLSITFFKPDIDFGKYDYLILTSKQAVEALKQYNKQNYITKKALCVSKATAKAYEDIGGEVLDIGGGYGDNLIDKITSYDKDKKWLYLRAKIVASDFVTVCKSKGYNIDEKIVYSSDCSKEILEAKIEDKSYLIFTSPSSIKCFLKTHKFKSTHKIVVIGKTTAKEIPKEIPYKISKETTIQSCIDLVLEDYEEYSS